MTCVVISQPMYFPWVGLFEQIRLADTYVHYDDVQFSKGSFSNRVQIKTEAGSKWLTIPLHNLHLGQKIMEVQPEPGGAWQAQHLAQLSQAYRKASHLREMLSLVGQVYASPAGNLADVCIAALEAVCRYFSLDAGRRFVRSSSLRIPGESSRRVLDVVKSQGGTVYVTGHGAKQYLDHEMFEREGVEVRYMDYRKTLYPQQHGEFTPFVSILDLIANLGREGARYIDSPAVPLKDLSHG